MPNEFAVAPPDNAADAVQNAIATGNISALKAVAPRVAGTVLSPVVNDVIGNMDRAVTPASRVIKAADENGGAGTPNGNIAVADQLVAEYKRHQPQTGFWQGISQALMGNKNWSNAMTAGIPTPAIIPGADGKFYTAIYNQNSPVPTMVYDENNNQVPYSQFLKLGGGGYKNITDTPGYISGKISTEEFTKANNQEQHSLNDAVGMFGNVINPLNERKMQALVELKKAGAELPNQVLNEIATLTSKRGSIGNTASTSYSNIAQANDVTSLNNALDKAKEAGLDLKVGPVVSMDAKGNIKTSDGSSTTKNDLLSKVKGGSNSSSVEEGWTTAREQIVKGELYKRLDPSQKALFDSIMDSQQAIDMAKAAYVNKHGWPSILSPSVSYQPGQTLNSNIANAFIDSANLEHAVQAKATLDQLLSKGVPIVPGSAAAAYFQSPAAASVNAKYSNLMSQALRLPTKEETVAPQKPKAPVAAASQESFSPGQEARLKKVEKLDTSRTNEAAKKVDDNQIMANALKKLRERQEAKK